MNESIRHWVESIALGIELVGVTVIVIGAIVATIAFAKAVPGPTTFQSAFHSYRTGLGRAILLGLEFLVAGDIITTILVEPSLEAAGGLALIVAIRTFLSFSLETEITGQLPWRRAEADPDERREI